MLHFLLKIFIYYHIKHVILMITKHLMQPVEYPNITSPLKSTTIEFNSISLTIALIFNAVKHKTFPFFNIFKRKIRISNYYVILTGYREMEPNPSLNAPIHRIPSSYDHGKCVVFIFV